MQSDKVHDHDDDDDDDNHHHHHDHHGNHHDYHDYNDDTGQVIEATCLCNDENDGVHWSFNRL